MVNISFYNIKLVKESCARYDVSKCVSKPLDMVKVLTEVVNIQENAEEVLIMIALNTKNMITGIFEVSRGSLNSSIVHPREIFKRALLSNASSIIIAHNHPSTIPDPSKEDIDITLRLREVSKIIGIELIDHIIIGTPTKYISLKEKGII